MKLDKTQLKKLIKEVIREAEEMSAEEPQSSEEPKSTSDDTMKHSRGQEEKESKTMIQLTLRGLKPGKAYKNVMAKMAHDAKMADLEVIHAEIQKNGRPVDSMDIGELKRAQAQAPEATKANVNVPDDFNLQNLTPEEQKEWETLLQQDPRDLDPAAKAKWKEEAKRLYRLSKIRPGEKEDEWKAMTARDVEGERQKAKLRAAKLAAGTLKTRPINPEDPNSPQVPVDSNLWTDKEWDMATQGGEAKFATDASGKQVYRPSFKKSDRAKGRTVFSPLNYNKQQ